jgi:curved DNA-binding protein CbpA
MSTSPPPNRRLEVKAQDLAQARNLHHHSQYTECAALLLTAERGAEDATALLKAALDGVRKHPRQALGLDDEATASDAKKSYRKLALKLHPDKTGGATSELFAALTEAHRAVSGEKRRAKAPKPPSRKSKPKPQKPPAPPEPPAQTRVDLDENQDQDSTWEKRYWALAAFKLKKGHCFPDGVLGDWCAAQRRAREEGKLSADRRQRLEQLGFDVDDDSWRAKAAAAAPSDADRAQAYWRRAKSERRAADRSPPRRRSSEAPRRRNRVDDALSGVAASLPGRRRPANRVAPPDRAPAPPPPPPPRARPVNNDAGCTGASDGWSWSRSRASTSNEARTERTTREFTLFGYVVARFETTSAYGQPASES